MIIKRIVQETKLLLTGSEEYTHFRPYRVHSRAFAQKVMHMFAKGERTIHSSNYTKVPSDEFKWSNYKKGLIKISDKNKTDYFITSTPNNFPFTTVYKINFKTERWGEHEHELHPICIIYNGEETDSIYELNGTLPSIQEKQTVSQITLYEV